MKDLNRVFVWPLEPFPAGAAMWPKSVGHLTGYGESRYVFDPDYFCPHIVTRGEGTIRTRRGEWRVTPGDLFTLWPGEHIEYFENPRCPWEFYWIHLVGEGAPAFVSACGFAPERISFTARDPKRVGRCFRQVHSAFQRQEGSDACRVLEWLYGMVPGCAPATPRRTRRRSSHEELVSRVSAMLETLLHTAVNVNEMAAMFQVSRATLFRAFRERLGKTPIQYLADVRLRRARELLRTTDHPLDEIAHASGFRGEKYFLRCFRQGTGQTPTAFRREVT